VLNQLPIPSHISDVNESAMKNQIFSRAVGLRIRQLAAGGLITMDAIYQKDRGQDEGRQLLFHRKSQQGACHAWQQQASGT
jgi:hypothetical protein